MRLHVRQPVQAIKAIETPRDHPIRQEYDDELDPAHQENFVSKKADRALMKEEFASLRTLQRNSPLRPTPKKTDSARSYSQTVSTGDLGKESGEDNLLESVHINTQEEISPQEPTTIFRDYTGPSPEELAQRRRLNQLILNTKGDILQKKLALKNYTNQEYSPKELVHALEQDISDLTNRVKEYELLKQKRINADITTLERTTEGLQEALDGEKAEMERYKELDRKRAQYLENPDYVSAYGDELDNTEEESQEEVWTY